MNDWQPRPADIEWTKSFLSRLRDGGTWGIPENHSIWKHDSTRRVLRCIYGERDKMFHQITTVCKLLNYTTEYVPENMTPTQVQDVMKLTESMFGTGKSLAVTDVREQPCSGPKKKYMWRPITDQDQATYRINLAKLPKHLRWKGKLTPQCDFCSNDKPVVTYGANRLTTGEAQRCWRWLACIECHDAITRNDFKTLERRACVFALGRVDENIAFTIKMALMGFHTDAIEV